MPTKDHHRKPFDEGTQTKLDIFEKYLNEWLPVFLKAPFNNPIQIFDLFAGLGLDSNGVLGSPLRTIEIIKKHSSTISQSGKIIHLFFNDLNKSKIKNLKELVSKKVTEYSLEAFVELKYTTVTFSQALQDYMPILKNGSNLLFIDQNGFKEVTEDVFKLLINLKRTDFLFFISSNHIRRFAETPEFHTYHPKFDSSLIKNTSRLQIHNVICEEYKKYVPAEIESFGLIPFSIIKQDKNNIYGLIFVCKHPLAAVKFLDVAWNQNELNGNANYDIDEDIPNPQPGLFDVPKVTKLASFQAAIKTEIIKGNIKNNRAVFYFTLNRGHVSKHAADVIMQMKREKLISFDSKSALVTYDMVIKKKRILEYKIVSK